MHIEGPWLSTTNTRKRAEKMTKAQREEFERNWRDRNKRLKEMGLPKQTFEEFLEFVHGKKEKTSKKVFKTNLHLPDLSYRAQKKINNQGDKEEVVITRPDVWITGPTSSKPSQTYTGEKILGIGTMHKSNMVPIFSDTEAEDISKMRR